MQWNSLTEFLQMGGYGLYVWGSFGACFVCIVGEIWLTRNRLSIARAQLQEELNEGDAV